MLPGRSAEGQLSFGKCVDSNVRARRVSGVTVERRFFRDLRASGVDTLDCDLDSVRFPADLLFAEEQAAASRMREARLREFAAGRMLARNLLTAANVKARAIPVGTGRAPVWPDGLTGSITHSRSICAAALARTSDHASIGIDIEELAPVEPNLRGLICSAEELDELNGIPGYSVGGMVCALFSAKEAFFKAWYPLTGIFLEYRDARVSLGSDLATFTLRVLKPDLSDVLGRFHGMIEFAHGHIATSVILAKHPFG